MKKRQLKPTGAKRFKQKGFKGHAINSQRSIESPFPPEMTNHEKMLYRKKLREREVNYEKES